MRHVFLAFLLAAACSYPDLPRITDGDLGDGGMDPDSSGTNALESLVFRAADNPSLTADVAATIDNGMITARVPLGANRSLVATFTTTGARVEIDGVAQESGVTANNFLGPRVYRVIAENGATMDYAITVKSPLAQSAYIKASNTGSGDSFGRSMALSADGSMLVVGASGEASNATGIDGNRADNSASASGAVYVLVRSGTTWTHQAYLKASNTEASDGFGSSVALSADGNTLAVGAPREDSVASGIGGNQADNTADGAGAVYVFTRVAGVWSQQAYVKASNTDASDGFGTSIALAGDGNTLAVTAPSEGSSATGVNGNQTIDTATRAGAAYVFVRTGIAWSQQAYLKASNTEAEDNFGEHIGISGDGSTIVVSAPREDSIAVGINGNGASNTASDAGAAYVFARSGTTWTQQAYVKAATTGPSDRFGSSVAISDDGNTLAVGAIYESGGSTGVDGDPNAPGGSLSGAVHVYARSGTTWTVQAYVKATNTGVGDHFGYRAALSGDGNLLLVTTVEEKSFASGVDGNQNDDTAPQAGAGYLYARRGTTWTPHAYLKASNTEQRDSFGESVAFARDGAFLAIGSTAEGSNATGSGGNQLDNSASYAGAVYLFH